MLQTYSSTEPALPEVHGQNFDVQYFVGIVKRRFLYFAIPFALVAILGTLITVIQRPIYRAEGTILVESPEIPTDLVRPTVMATADERIQVIQQRIMARDSLVAVINKFGLFRREQQEMSGTELLDLMRSRMEIEPVDPDQPRPGAPTPTSTARLRKNTSTIAFTLSFDYEIPDLAMKVANDFLTSILSEDARSRTSRASDTTKFLEREVKRLQGQHDAVEAQIMQAKQRPRDLTQATSDQIKLQTTTLATLQSDLIQKSSVYSSEHPEVKNLKKRIAALENALSKAPPAPPAAAPDSLSSGDVAIDELERQEASIDKILDDANNKLTAARLGENMERDQQAERLQVIEQPGLPQRPVRPNRLKWFAVVFALAGMVGGAFGLGSEMLDGSIRGAGGLVGVVDSHLIVTIPYISTAAEEQKKRRRFILMWSVFAAALVAGVAVAIIVGISVDSSWFDRSWLDALTRLSR